MVLVFSKDLHRGSLKTLKPKIMSIIQTKSCNGGFSIEIGGYKKNILSATSTGGNKISLNDTVISNGRVFCPDGIPGRVVEIDEPHTNGTTDHIFLVDFGSHGHYHMGFQDLQYKNGSYVFHEVPKIV
jgi:hypothetical protein